MARGVYRIDDEWVQVNYGKHELPIMRERYETKSYQPPFDELPTEAEYRAARRREHECNKG